MSPENFQRLPCLRCFLLPTLGSSSLAQHSPDGPEMLNDSPDQHNKTSGPLWKAINPTKAINTTKFHLRPNYLLNLSPYGTALDSIKHMHLPTCKAI